MYLLRTDTSFVFVILALAIFFAVLGIGLVVFVYFYYNKRIQYQKEREMRERTFREELLQIQVEAQEFTFNQISQELHDNIGQLLSSTKMLLGTMERQFPEVPEILITAEQTLSKAIQDLRSLSKSLSKEWLTKFNLMENLSSEVQRINNSREICAELHFERPELPLDAEKQVMLFRVLQEAIQNSIKHALARHITIEMKSLNHQIAFYVKDDGCGFDFATTERRGLGLQNMIYRTQLLGGSIDWKSNDSKGTFIEILLPKKD